MTTAKGILKQASLSGIVNGYNVQIQKLQMVRFSGLRPGRWGDV